MNTHAFANRGDLHRHASSLDTVEPSKAAFDQKAREPEQGRPSEMVTKDRPHPAPKPSPDMAHEVDRQSFNQRWSGEAKAARKAAFIKERTDPQTGGRVRVFNRQATRDR